MSSVCNMVEDAKKACGMRRIYPCHCVSLLAKSKMAAVFPVTEVGVGMTIFLPQEADDMGLMSSPEMSFGPGKIEVKKEIGKI